MYNRSVSLSFLILVSNYIWENLLATSTFLLSELTPALKRITLRSLEAIFRPEDVSGLAKLRNLTNLCVDHIKPGLVLPSKISHIIHFTEALILSKERHKRYCQLASYFLILFLWTTPAKDFFIDISHIKENWIAFWYFWLKDPLNFPFSGWKNKYSGLRRCCLCWTCLGPASPAASDPHRLGPGDILGACLNLLKLTHFSTNSKSNLAKLEHKFKHLTDLY